MIIAFIIICALPLASLLVSGLPVTHDGQDHVARIANFYQSLTEGNIVPRWAGDLNWGYGHPILMFLYPLPSYIASLFHAIGFSFVDSTKLVFATAFVLSMAGMYVWASAVWGMWPAAAASMLYGFAPYRFVDLYVRGAIGEHMAFVFLPFALWGLYNAAASAGRNTRRGFRDVFLGEGVIGLATASLVLSHNAMSIMFLPLIAAYALYLYTGIKKGKRRFAVTAGISVLFGFALSAFFWVPAYFEGKYTLRDIVTADSLSSRFASFADFVYSPWNYGGTATLPKSLGLAQWGVIAAAVVFLIQKRKLPMLWGAAAALAGSLFLMTSVSAPIWESVRLLQKFQFPWRFLSVSVSALAVMGAVIVASSGKKQAAATCLIAVTALAGTWNMWRPQAFRVYQESFFTGVYESTTDTGESSPVWSVRFMEHRPESPMEVISGDADISEGQRTSTEHEYYIKAKTPVRLVENTLYFPGWTITADGMPLNLQFQDPSYRGLMTFELPRGEYTVRAEFRETKLRMLADAVSIAGFGAFMVFLGTISVWQKRKR